MSGKALCPVVVGRESEISRLEDSLLMAIRGEGNLVALSGDAGVGKSRLAIELKLRAEKLRAQVMSGACSEAELALPYLPFLEAIGDYLATAELKRLKRRLGVSRRELARLFPQLGDETAAASTGDGQQARQRLYESLLGLLRIVAEEKGLLLVIEDLHWADDSTRELVDYLSRRLGTNRILILATYRGNEVLGSHPLLPVIQGWRRSRLADFVELEPLDSVAVGRMVSAIFDEPTRDDTRQFLYARSEGNPFVLEEMLKVALNSGDVFRTPAGWTRKALAEIRLPASVRDSILLRVQRLKANEREVLRTAAVLGTSFDFTVLSDLCGRDVEDELEVLVQQQLIEEARGTIGQHRFRHALTQEAIYDAISAPKRARFHSLAAEVMRKRTTTAAIDVAHHLLRANLQKEALPILLHAADDADSARAYREAAELRKRALPAVTNAVDRAALAGKIGETLWLAGLTEAAMPFLKDAIETLGRSGRVAEAEHLRVILGRVQWASSRQDLAAVEFGRAAEALAPFGPSADLALALMSHGALEAISHHGERAEQFLMRALEVATEAGAEEVKIWSLQYLSIGVADRNRYEEAVALLEQSYEEAMASGLVMIAEHALNNLNSSFLWWPRPGRYQEVIDRLHDLGTESASAAALKWEAIAAYHRGDLSGSVDASERWLEMAVRLGNLAQVRSAESWLVTILSLMGRVAEARKFLLKPNPATGIQAAVDGVEAWCRFHLAVGDPAAAAEGAQIVATEPIALARALPWLDSVMEALVAARKLEPARSIARAARLEPGCNERPYLLLTLARFELAESRAELAGELARKARDAFELVGDQMNELIARIVLAEALADTAEVVAAKSEVVRCLADSRRMQAHYLEDKVTALASRLGLEVPEVPVDRDGIEVGEKLVTVLFADIRGYTSMTSDLPPAVMADRISAFQRWAKQEVNRHRGMIDKFAGDAVMATFNVSGTSIDHTRHALEAAVALRDKAALLDLQVGVGIAVGPAIVGRLVEGGNVSVLGETTNLASRLQSEAGPGELMLSDEAYRRLSDVGGRPEKLRLKGIRNQVLAYRLPGRQVRFESHREV